MKHKHVWDMFRRWWSSFMILQRVLFKYKMFLLRPETKISDNDETFQTGSNEVFLFFCSCFFLLNLTKLTVTVYLFKLFCCDNDPINNDFVRITKKTSNFARRLFQIFASIPVFKRGKTVIGDNPFCFWEIEISICTIQKAIMFE